MTFPDLTRGDATIALISPWLEDPCADHDVVEDAARERPDGLVSLTSFAAEEAVLHYAQWRDEATCEGWLAGRSATRYIVHRSYRGTGDASPAMLATPLFACEGPASQIALCDGLVGALRDLTPRGLLAAHLHCSVDGARVVNYAEWRSEDDWRAFIDDAYQHMLDVFHEIPGVQRLNLAPSVARYHRAERRV